MDARNRENFSTKSGLYIYRERETGANAFATLKANKYENNLVLTG